MSVLIATSSTGSVFAAAAAATKNVVRRKSLTQSSEIYSCTKNVTDKGRQGMHQAVAYSSPLAGSIPMPPNVEELQASEKARFSPHRARDTSSAHLAAKLNQPSGVFGGGFMGDQGTKQSFNLQSSPVDNHVGVYDCGNAVSLSSVMQTNVPKPFNCNTKGNFVHLNMPGGQWAQDDKYISGDLHDYHYSRLMGIKKSGTASVASWCGLARTQTVCKTNAFLHGTKTFTRCRFFHCSPIWRFDQMPFCRREGVHDVHVTHSVGGWWSACEISRSLSTGMTKYSSQEKELPETSGEKEPVLTQRQKLQRAVKEYGSTVIVFHVTISLASLGFFYLLVSSGVDTSGMLEYLGINLKSVSDGATVAETADSSSGVPSTETASDTKETNVSGESAVVTVGTFVVAYAIHKVFAPARIVTTLTATPFIVRHLRRIGFLKPPQAKPV
ncbi:uncharacterized protein LOC143028186 [Oratosquilla oratoria]|uniref:uncharacterized protein LOC143028186 n=1 Tax=Oratosquilla oratoria TaxID=337810 RepID=UPI003F76F1A8